MNEEKSRSISSKRNEDKKNLFMPSLHSIIKNKFVSSNVEIGSKSLPLGDLIKFARTAYKGPELFILEKIIKKDKYISFIERLNR